MFLMFMLVYMDLIIIMLQVDVYKKIRKNTTNLLKLGQIFFKPNCSEKFSHKPFRILNAFSWILCGVILF